MQEERRVLSQERVAGSHVIIYVGMFIHMTRIHNLIEMFVEIRSKQSYLTCDCTSVVDRDLMMSL